MALIIVFAPRKNFSGVSCGVTFAQGKALADEEKDAAALAYFRRAGYTIGGSLEEVNELAEQSAVKTEDTPVEVTATPDVEVDYGPSAPPQSATRADWADYAEELEIELPARATVAQIKALVAEHITNEKE